MLSSCESYKRSSSHTCMCVLIYNWVDMSYFDKQQMQNITQKINSGECVIVFWDLIGLWPKILISNVILEYLIILDKAKNIDWLLCFKISLVL